MTYLLIPVIASLFVIVWYLDTRQKNLVLRKFINRELIGPAEQLSDYFDNHQALEIAVGLWNELAQAYGISPSQLRPKDNLEEIISSDVFGDNGLEIEKKLEQSGITGKLEKLSILELITLYVSHAQRKTV